MPGIHKHDNGTWYIRFSKNGKEVRKSLKTKDKKEALQIKKEVEQTLLAHKLGLIKPELLEESEEESIEPEVFWKKFSKWAEEHKRPKNPTRFDIIWEAKTNKRRDKEIIDVLDKNAVKPVIHSLTQPKDWGRSRNSRRS